MGAPAWDHKRARGNLAKAGPVGQRQAANDRSLGSAPANPPNELLADPERLRWYVLCRLDRMCEDLERRGNIPLLLEVFRLAAILSPIDTAPPNAQRLDA